MHSTQAFGQHLLGATPWGCGVFQSRRPRDQGSRTSTHCHPTPGCPPDPSNSELLAFAPARPQGALGSSKKRLQADLREAKGPLDCLAGWPAFLTTDSLLSKPTVEAADEEASDRLGLLPTL